MVQKDPIDNDELASDPEAMFKKKPVRKATAKTNAKTSADKTTATATKGRATRGKKVEPEEAVEVVEEAPVKTAKRAPGRPKKDAAPVEEVAEVAKTMRATKTGSVRGRTAAAPVEEAPEAEVEQPKVTRATKSSTLRGRKTAAPAAEEEPAAKETNPTKTTKAGSVRGRKAAPAVEDPPVLAAPEPKATRGTRATAAKAQPLSPKKITQVSKPAARATTTAKPAAKAAPTKAPAKTTTRKRTVSDENADVAELQTAFEDEDTVVMLSSTPAKSLPAPGRGKKQPTQQEQSEASLSSRPTTPNDSTLQSFGQDELTMEDEADDAGAVSEQEDIDNTAEEEVSEDELCGPKTPMKRGNASAEAAYLSSVQRTIRKYEQEQRVETPARRHNVLGSQRGTPQTQKPYCKPQPPSSAIRPMTVSRATNRAFVFRDIREGVPSLPELEDEPIVEEDDELSFVVDDNIIPMDKPESEHDDEVSEPATPTTTTAAPLQLPSPSVWISDVEEVAKDEEPAQTFISHSVHEDGFIAPAEIEQDPDETMLAEDAPSDGETDDEEGDDEQDISQSITPSESFETDDTVIITRPARKQEEQTVVDHTVDTVAAGEQDSTNHHKSLARNSDIEVLDWQKPTKQDNTITVNFADLFSGARSAGHGDLVEERAGEGAAALDVEEGADDSAVDPMDVDFDTSLEGASVVNEAESRRQTLDLNEFVDMAALTEPTELSNLSDMHHADHETEMGVESEADLGAALSLSDDVDEDVCVETVIEDDHSTVEEAMLCAVPSTSHDLEQDAAEESATATAKSVPEPEAGATDVNSPVLDDDMFDLDYSRPQPQAQPEVEPAQAAIEAEEDVPHYALPTIAYDARRKSLPAIMHQTPAKAATRPHTSDGASMPRIVNPFSDQWWSRSRATSVSTTHAKSRQSTAHTMPLASSPMKSPAAKTPTATPGERFPRRAPRQDYEDHAQTVAAPRFQTPVDKPATRRQTFHRAASGRLTAFNPKPAAIEAPQAEAIATPKAVESVPTTPDFITNATETPTATPGERYPRMNLRKGYAEHAQTVAAPRFRTPAKTTPLKRPATTQKPESLRKAALKANTPMSSRTPIKTPLKAPAMTPGQEPMTPHPAAPLRGVVALVEVFTLEGSSASAPFVALLHRLGAKTTKAWSDRVSHVIFKDGSPTTLQRVRLNNKAAAKKGSDSVIHCVNSRWITDCDNASTRMDEADEAYAVDVAEVPRGGKRRRKSMEPSALLNIGGNIVRDRKSSTSRVSSFGRSSLLKMVTEAPAEPGAESTPMKDVSIAEKENSGEECSSPVTPAWIKEPSALVQQTAPMNRVRKLDLPGKDMAKHRRLTFWNGGN